MNRSRNRVVVARMDLRKQLINRWFVLLGAGAAVMLAALVWAGVFSGGSAWANENGSGPATWEEFEAQTREAAENADGQRPAAGGRPQVGWLSLEQTLIETPPPFSMGTETGPSRFSMRGVLGQLRHVATSPNHKGLVLFLDGAPLSLSQVWELREAIGEVREADKTVIVFAESYNLRDFLLASAADKVLIQRGGMVELSGLAVEEMYLAGLFEKVGIKADLMQLGDFKGAAEPFTRRAPSEEWDRMFDALLDDLYGQIVGQIAEGRKITREALEKVMAEGFTMSAAKMVESGLVDAVVDRDLREVTGELFGVGFGWDRQMGLSRRSSRMDNPFAALSMLMQSRERPLRRTTIGVLHVNGAIQSGDGGQGLLGGSAAGSRTILRAAADLRDEARIAGVVVRIESPGGSAQASEVIWQAIRELAEEKPVYVSIGNMAASGGYYIAAAGERIYVTPSSLVGSIGVVGGKFVLGELYEKLGVSIHRRARGPLGDPFNSVEPFTDEQRRVVRRAFAGIYEQFLDRIRQGRGEKIQDMDAVVGGRVFTGQQAVANGLADEVGGLQAAITGLATKLELAANAYDVVEYPRPMPLAEYLDKVFGVSAPGPRQASGAAGFGPQALEGLTAIRAVVGERTWQSARPHLEGLLLLRNEPALLLMPSAVILP
ncbi:MAG: signal peptide peptidase SppA [Phycisphaeraceae bacterium]|nr:signal peptide peptidase SppA [Phycisphaeraceae bacterium]